MVQNFNYLHSNEFEITMAIGCSGARNIRLAYGLVMIENKFQKQAAPVTHHENPHSYVPGLC